MNHPVYWTHVLVIVAATFEVFTAV